MGEFATMAGEILFAVLPQSDWGKLLGLVIVGFFILVVTGKFPLEWIGRGTRHIYRWLRCKIMDRHYYIMTNQGRPVVFEDGSSGILRECRICGKDDLWY